MVWGLGKRYALIGILHVYDKQDEEAFVINIGIELMAEMTQAKGIKIIHKVIIKRIEETG